MNGRVATLIAFLAIVSVAFPWGARATKSAVAKPATVQHARPKKEPLKVRSDLDWKKLSEAELREFSSYFGDAKSPTNFKMETVVASGETILADVYEGRPGEYVFSKMTPTFKTRDDGTTIVEVTMESFGLSLSGGQRDIISRTWELEPRGIYTTGSLVEGGIYTITTAAKAEENNQTIRIKADGSFRKSDPAPPP